GEPVVPVAVKMLQDERWYVVRNMVTVLGGVGSGEAVKALGRLADDPDYRIRRELARALARLPGSEADRLLVGLLADREPAVRLTAVDAAASRRSSEMLDALWSCYESSPDWELRAAILRALGRTGLPEAAERLEAVARTRPLLHRRRWEALQVAALEALAALGGQAAAAALERLGPRRAAAPPCPAGRPRCP
ncbi:MAG: HEAT repeat domain-containing protein, partial [Deltaproteobacteria bacterium]|nr:HEAT repeat domain-containing protein [Deltaproteobacteria bacterium]